MSLATLLSITNADVARLAKLESASYLCLWDETVSPGFPTRTRLLIWSQSPRDDCSFQLSAAGLSSVRFRFPDQPLPQDQSRPRSEFDAAPRAYAKVEFA